MKTAHILPWAIFTCAAAVVLWVGTVPSVSAHPSMRNYIQHRAVIDDPVQNRVGEDDVELMIKMQCGSIGTQEAEILGREIHSRKRDHFR